MSRSFQIRFDFVLVCSSISGLAVGFSVSDLLVSPHKCPVSKSREQVDIISCGIRQMALIHTLSHITLRYIKPHSGDPVDHREILQCYRIEITSHIQSTIAAQLPRLQSTPHVHTQYSKRLKDNLSNQVI